LKSLASILTPPLLCVGVLTGIAAINATHKTPADAAPYHARAKDAIEAFAWNITDPLHPEDGIWAGKEVAPAKEAVRLLRPNCIISREYTDTRSNDRHGSRNCAVLIVQCRDSRDMVGHYPENCYPHVGELMVDKRERDWTIGNKVITGMEYTFERFSRGQPVRRCVYNFLIVPGVGILRDIKGVNKAAEDYQRRHFGAAQFQFVFQAREADLSREKRDQIFKTLMGSNMGVFDALENAKID
jgi:hypothetical protein